MDSHLVSVGDLHPVKLLQALWEAAQAQGNSWAALLNKRPSWEKIYEALYNQAPMPNSPEERRETRIDYLYGKVMKVDFPMSLRWEHTYGPEIRDRYQIDPRLYDRDNGAGAFQSVVDTLRAKGK